MPIKCRNILPENYIDKSLQQGVVDKKRVTCPKCCYLPTQYTLGSTLYLYMNLWLELDNCHSATLLVIPLHRYPWVAGLIPAGVLIVAYIAF